MSVWGGGGYIQQAVAYPQPHVSAMRQNVYPALGSMVGTRARAPHVVPGHLVGANNQGGHQVDLGGSIAMLQGLCNQLLN